MPGAPRQRHEHRDTPRVPPYASAPSSSRRNSSSIRAFTYHPSVMMAAPNQAAAVPRMAAVATDASVIPV